MPHREGIKRGLVLLVDGDPRTARVVEPLAAERGLELVHARTGIAALEIVQRVGDSFRFAMVSLELPDIPGLVVIEVLRQFWAGLPVVCLTDVLTAATAPCLLKPVTSGPLAVEMDEAMAGTGGSSPSFAFPTAAVARARARYESSRDLVAAALELARGLPDEPRTEV
jgi:hypothetical protein